MAVFVACAVTLSSPQTIVAQAKSASYTDGTALVKAMHDRYDGKWYKTLTFVQTTTRYDSTGKASTDTWYETASVPSKLRIDIGSPTGGRGVLYTADSTYVVRDGHVVRVVAGGNELTTLLFDVYIDPVDKTLSLLSAAGYDLKKLHRQTWEGQPVIVVGADSGDLKPSQFWVDPERLVVVRQLSPIKGLPGIADAQFTKYVRTGGGWIALRNAFYLDGKPLQLEEYHEVKSDVPLDPALFDPTKWSTAKHWASANK